LTFGGVSNRITPRRGVLSVDNELISALEGRVESMLESYASMKRENARLSEENEKLRSDRETVKVRLDNLLKKLENL